jgi:hypothetical protein
MSWTHVFMSPLRFALLLALTAVAGTSTRHNASGSPLAIRSWGLEISPLYPLVYRGHGVAGTVSNFSVDRFAELALPYLYLVNSDDTRLVHMDVHYRRFISGSQSGFYVSGFARYQHVVYFDAEPPADTDWQRTRLDRLGAGLGIGTRVFWTSGFYYGCGVSFGRYFSGNPVDSDYPDHLAIWSGRKILDFEFLKIGYAF